MSLVDFGWDDRGGLEAVAAGHQLGRIARIDRGAVFLAVDGDIRRARVPNNLKRARDPLERPTIGDWVEIDDDSIVALLPRSSAFVRGDVDRLQGQVVAANVDTVFVVQSAAQDPNPRRLERELVLAWQSGATPVVVLNKIDLCADPAAMSTVLAGCAPGSDLVPTSAKTKEGVDRLAAYGVPHRTLAFIGASGVGKSTLINALLGSDVQRTNATREGDERGRHTTTTRELFPLVGGGILVDTPGLRSVGMWRSDEGLALAFSDIERVARSCKFSDCTHDHEPACAVLAAVARGDIEGDRVTHYQRLQSELDHLDDEAEARHRVVKQQDRAARDSPR